MSSTCEVFRRQFVFDVSKTGCIGIEREAFLRSMKSGQIVPRSQALCELLVKKGRFLERFGPELSACQIESRTTPVKHSRLSVHLLVLDQYLRASAETLGLQIAYEEVAPADMSTAVYPEKRYQQIAEVLPLESLLAACRVAGTHVHVGMPDFETALRVYNVVIRHAEELCLRGDGSGGERMRLYQIVAGKCNPPVVSSIEELFSLAQEQGFAHNLRNWWSLIRITRYGTIEFRMFGSTPSIGKIVGWAKRCHELCMTAM
ncbi:MAG: hypothetical protein RL097_325 [Candidatus Parcubacteria bacterium]|jgi:gamma-glutamyl:cysteine ligase YbdK (ATP-grasp superfamily)